MYGGVYDYIGKYIYILKNTEIKMWRTKILSSVLYVWVWSLILGWDWPTREKVIGIWRNAVFSFIICTCSWSTVIRAVKRQVDVAHIGACVHNSGQKTWRDQRRPRYRWNVNIKLFHKGMSMSSTTYMLHVVWLKPLVS